MCGRKKCREPAGEGRLVQRQQERIQRRIKDERKRADHDDEFQRDDEGKNNTLLATKHLPAGTVFVFVFIWERLGLVTFVGFKPAIRHYGITFRVVVPTDSLGWKCIEGRNVRLDVKQRRIVQNIPTVHPKKVTLDFRQSHSGKPDRIGTARSARSKQTMWFGIQEGASPIS